MSNFRQDIIFTLIRRGALTAAEVAMLNDYEIEDIWDELEKMRREGLVSMLTSAEFHSGDPRDDELDQRRVIRMARRLGCDYQHLDVWWKYCGGPISRAFVEADATHAHSA
jgi:hypothetical protein